MTFTSKKELEIKLSDICNPIGLSYGKTRVSGSKKKSYFMHPRSKSMPGQSQLFSTNINLKKKYGFENDMLQIRRDFIRNNYRNQKNIIGTISTQTSLDLYTYQKFSPYNDESLNLAIISSYKQIFGNLLPMESERPIDLERKLRNGDLTIRDFIRSLAKSSFYRKYYFELVSQDKCLKLNFMHILGRPLIDQVEIQKNIALISQKGFEAHVDFLVDSLEYEQAFGEDLVPFQRFWNSPCGATTSSFINTASFNKGFASSDNVNL